MRKCIRCGRESDTSFCVHCGGKVEDVVDKKNVPLERDEQSQATLNLLKKLNNDSRNETMSRNVGTNRPMEWILAMCSFCVSTLFLILGFYKMWAYDDGDYGNAVNAYVGGDAYNYIINGTYATAFFVLTGSFLLAGILFLILDAIKKCK